jgi:hypothetical protein
LIALCFNRQRGIVASLVISCGGIGTVVMVPMPLDVS